MPVLLSIIILLCDRTLIIESTPKLGHILSDPLSNEAKLSGMDIKNIIFNIMNNSFHDTSTEKHKDLVIPLTFNLRKSENTLSTQKPSSDYNFNDTICKTVNDRVMCGYDKNLGNVDDKIVDLGNGCRIRGDRLECGYLVGPFNNPRRPPVKELDEQDIENNNQKLSHILEQFQNNTVRSNPDTSTPSSIKVITSKTRKKKTIRSTIDTKASSSIVKIIKTTFTSLSSTESQNNIISGTKAAVTKKNKKQCVEKNGSIFCYTIKT